MRLHLSVDGFDIWMDESAAFQRIMRDGRPVGCLLWMLNGLLPFHPIRNSSVYAGIFIALSGVLVGCMTQAIAELGVAPSEAGICKRIEQILSLFIILAGGILCVYVPHMLTVPI